MRTLFTLLTALAVSLTTITPAAANGLEFERPVPGAVVDAFRAPADTYAPGHRGVDLAADTGAAVRAPAGGRVRFAGYVAGTGTVSIDLGNGWRTTLQPVAPAVVAGDDVRSGEAIGTLAAGHCGLAACLHWGLTDGETYLDPMDYLTVPVIRLVPLGSTPEPLPFLPAASTTTSGAPVDGPITSPFGMRRHPVTGVFKLHDGVDYAAACGTAVAAPSSGVVVSASFDGAYGYRVKVDHGGGLITAYAHLQALDVSAGQQVITGEALGRVGSTGLSTGCHLHWMAWRDGTLIDPETLP